MPTVNRPPPLRASTTFALQNNAVNAAGITKPFRREILCAVRMWWIHWRCTVCSAKKGKKVFFLDFFSSRVYVRHGTARSDECSCCVLLLFFCHHAEFVRNDYGFWHGTWFAKERRLTHQRNHDMKDVATMTTKASFGFPLSADLFSSRVRREASYIDAFRRWIFFYPRHIFYLHKAHTHTPLSHPNKRQTGSNSIQARQHTFIS